MFIDPCEVINVDEMAEILMIGKNAAYDLLNSGKIKALKIGRIWKVPKVRLNEYLQESSSARTG